MWDIFKKFRYYILAGVILFASFMFYALNLKNQGHANLFERSAMNLLAPVTGVISRVNAMANGVWRDYVALVDLRKENKLLRENQQILNARVIESQEALIANERLKKLLDLKGSLQVQSVAAQVIGEDGSPWFKTIMIDKGEGDGLQEGMPVVTAEGVVGQVVKMAWHSSRVLLFTDHASSIAAMVQRSRARGVVRGKGGGNASLEFAMRDEDVKVGDLLLTSGTGGIFPKGLVIGEVTMVKKGEYGIFQTIDVRPAVNIMRLEEVLVLLQKPRG
jgi:rod shape-determining protein MreC